MTKTLIERLKAEIYQHVDFDAASHAVWYRNGLRKAIEIVREHETCWQPIDTARVHGGIVI
jgi:hypothetical protein